MTRKAMRIANVHTFVFILGVACVKPNDITVRTSAIDDRSPSDTGDDYDFQRLPSDAYIQQKPGFYAIHGDSDWGMMWNETPQGTHPPLPGNVDFKKNMLFVATSKTPNAKAIEVQKITHTAEGLKIYVLETLPLESCPPQPRKGPPIDVVSLNNVPFDMHVVYDRVHAESCGPPPEAVIACRVAGSGSAGGEKIAASPGDVIDCDSSQSRPQLGAITGRKWNLHEPPPGSRVALTVGKGDIGVTFSVDAWGTYEVDLDVRDATRDGTTTGIVEVLPPDAGVELFFSRVMNPDPRTLPRVELHVVQLPMALASSGDCALGAERSFCDVHQVGGVQQAILRPEANKRYRVVAKYLDARLPGAPVACIRAFAKGVAAASTCEAEDAQRAANATWELGALDVPHVAFYDAKLPKPPALVTTSATASVPVPPPTVVVVPPTPKPPPPTIPPPSTPSATATTTIEL